MGDTSPSPFDSHGATVVAVSQFVTVEPYA